MSRSSRLTDVGEDFAEIGVAAPGLDVAQAAPGAHLGARRHEELHVGLRADHRADVAAVEHRAAGLRGEGALLVDQDLAHAREDGDLGGRLAHLMRRQRLAVEVLEIDLARGGLGRRDIVERQAVDEQRMADGAVGQPGVEMRQVVIVGQPARQRAFAGGGGAVYGDGEGGGQFRSRGVAVSEHIVRFKARSLPRIFMSRLDLDRAFS